MIALLMLSRSHSIRASNFLGSASTHVLSGLGGFEGRALRKGDVLELGADPQGPQVLGNERVPAHLVERLAPRKVLRVTVGPQSASSRDNPRPTPAGT